MHGEQRECEIRLLLLLFLSPSDFKPNLEGSAPPWDSELCSITEPAQIISMEIIELIPAIIFSVLSSSFFFFLCVCIWISGHNLYQWPIWGEQ